MLIFLRKFGLYGHYMITTQLVLSKLLKKVILPCLYVINTVID